MSKKILVGYQNKNGKVSKGNYLFPLRSGKQIQWIDVKAKKIYSQGQVLKTTTELNNTELLQLVVDAGCIVDSVADCLKDLDAYLSCLRDSKLMEIVDLSRFYVGWEISKKKRINKKKKPRRA